MESDARALVDGLVGLVALVIRQSQDVMDAHWPGLSLTPHQWFALAALHHGPMRMGQLAALLKVSVTNATGILSRLEDRGLVARQRDPHDRRAVQVSLTEEARALNACMMAARRGLLEPAVTALPAEERAVLARVLASVQRSMAPEMPKYLNDGGPSDES